VTPALDGTGQGHRAGPRCGAGHRRAVARLFVVLPVLLAAILVAAAAADLLHGPQPLWRAQFPDGHGLITNEVAYRDPDRPGAHISPDWMVTSGSLFADDGGASTGEIDGDSPDVDSRHATGSAVLRAVTVRDDFLDVRITLDLRVVAMTTTERTDQEDFDGVHLMLRYLDPDQLYTIDLCRRDDTVTIKKKVTGDAGPDGAYHTMAEAPYDCVRNRWRTFTAQVNNEAEGVRLTLSTPERQVMTALDKGGGGQPPLIRAGHVGVRGDNTSFRFRDFVVWPA
jgi:hypothetical protein